MATVPASDSDDIMPSFVCISSRQSTKRYQALTVPTEGGARGRRGTAGGAAAAPLVGGKRDQVERGDNYRKRENTR